MKYIVLSVKKPGSFSLELPVIFPEMMTHALVAECMKLAVDTEWPGCVTTPISAGFVSSMDAPCDCYGESETLKLKSRPEDARLIQMSDYGGNHV